VIDDSDTCVPIGGFINGIRPIKLALELIEAAEAGSTYVSPYTGPRTGQTDLSDATFSGLVFSNGVVDDQPPTVLDLIPSGATEVCAFWDYEGMADGASWDAIWFVNGELDEGGSLVDKTWVHGESGDTWVCVLNQQGLEDGLYELFLSVEGRFMLSDSVTVGDEQLVEVDLLNDLPAEICHVYLSPSDETNWGEDELGEEEVIAPGSRRTFSVPAGTYDVLLEDCDEKTIFERYDLDFSEDEILSVG
jgi:hypothetical protein